MEPEGGVSAEDKRRARKESDKKYRQANKERRKEYGKKWCEANPEYHRKYCQENKEHIREWKRNYDLVKKYGITIEKKRVLWQRTEGICKICRKAMDFDSTYVDHDHKTGKIRGLIHGNCNLFVGLLEKNPERINNVKDYLEKHNGSGGAGMPQS